MRAFRKKAKRADGEGAGETSHFHPDSGQRLQVRKSLHEGRVQAKPEISSPGDASEKEADRAAEAVMHGPETGGAGAVPTLHERPMVARAETSGGGAPPAASADAAVRGVRYGGEPLPGPARGFFERRFGRDFGSVRIHTGGEARSASQALGAEAYTYRDHIGFAEGRYSPDTHQGRKLLAHELAHVTQQGNAVRRREDKQAKAADPGFSVNPTNYGFLLERALELMKGKLQDNNTLAATMEPMLRAMAAKPEWRDASGKSTGGKTVSHPLPWDGKQKVNLRLVCDDAVAPKLTGAFNSSGKSSGTITVFIRDNESAETLSTTLYHETLHLIAWIGKHQPAGKDLGKEMGATKSQLEVLKTLDPSEHAPLMKILRKRVGRLGNSVNAERKSTEQVSADDLDRLAGFLLNEFLTRIETEVFRLFRDTQAMNDDKTGKALVLVGTNEAIFPPADVETYLFDNSGIFKEADRKSLVDIDRKDMEEIAKLFKNRVKGLISRRFSFTVFRDPMTRPEVDLIELPRKSLVDKVQPPD